VNHHLETTCPLFCSNEIILNGKDEPPDNELPRNYRHTFACIERALLDATTIPPISTTHWTYHDYDHHAQLTLHTQHTMIESRPMLTLSNSRMGERIIIHHHCISFTLDLLEHAKGLSTTTPTPHQAAMSNLISRGQ
jgi:hypothetical protein